MITVAQSLDDVYLTLSPQPLLTRDELRHWYRDVNPVRGGGVRRRIALGLQRSLRPPQRPYKAFVMGHSGSGKSTEITCLIEGLGSHFQTLRCSAANELDPVEFRPFDVVLLSMIEIVERTTRPVVEGGLGRNLPKKRLEELLSWFREETRSTDESLQASASAAAGVQGESSLLGKVLGLFANLRAEAKFATNRSRKVVEYRLRRLSELIHLANRVLADCNQLLAEDGRSWLIVWEDFDKPGFQRGKVEDLFLTYANIWKELSCHLLITLPITLGWSSAAARLPFAENQTFSIPDIPVFTREHAPHQAGRRALADLLAARVDPGLFEAGQGERLTVASGGNLRDLFALVARAADNALLREEAGAARIAAVDAQEAVVWLRTRYERRLGTSEDDSAGKGFREKVARMLAIYAGSAGAAIPDACLYSVLRARAVQEFDGDRWLGLHPLVVDILRRNGDLPEDAPGGTD